jgi:phosphate:Na+ symporter
MFSGLLVIFSGLAIFFFSCFSLAKFVTEVFNLHLRSYIAQMNQSRWRSFVFGFFATAAFQSSTAAILLAVGLIESGLILFQTAFPYILATCVASTITPLLVVFKFTVLSPYFLLIGGLLWLSGQKKIKKFGEIIFYFGLIFFSLDLMSRGTESLDTSFLSAFFLSSHLYLSIILGFLVALISQSTSVALTLLIVLSQQGQIDIAQSLPIILGVNLGNIFTESLVAWHGNAENKRLGLGLFSVKVFGVIVSLLCLKYFVALFELLPVGGWQVLGAHFLFNLLIVSIFSVCFVSFVNFFKKIIPRREHDFVFWPLDLTKELTLEPAKAVAAVSKEIKGAGEVARRMFSQSVENIFLYDSKKENLIHHQEVIVDNIQGETLKFLDSIPKEKLNKEETKRIIVEAEIIDSWERIGDRSYNLNDLARHRKEKNVEFSQEAMKEVEEIVSLINKKFIFLENREERLKSEAMTPADAKIEVSQNNHFERFYARQNVTADGSIFNNILVNLQAIDHHLMKIIFLTDKIYD